MSQDKLEGIPSLSSATAVNATQKLNDVNTITALTEVSAQTELTGIQQIDQLPALQSTQAVTESKEVAFFDEISEIAENAQLSVQEIYEKTALEVLQRELSLSPELLAQLAPQVGDMIANDPFLSQAILSLLRSRQS
jgi:hypothetical protein